MKVPLRLPIFKQALRLPCLLTTVLCGVEAEALRRCGPRQSLGPRQHWRDASGTGRRSATKKDRHKGRPRLRRNGVTSAENLHDQFARCLFWLFAISSPLSAFGSKTQFDAGGQAVEGEGVIDDIDGHVVDVLGLHGFD